MSAYLEKEFERMTKSKIEFFPSSGPVHEWTAHLHPAVEILYFFRGEYIVTVDEETILTTKPGDMIVVPSNAIHALTKKNPNRCCIIRSSSIPICCFRHLSMCRVNM